MLIRLIRDIWRSRDSANSPVAGESGAQRAEFDALHLAGVRACESGRLEEAGQLIAGALKIDPRSAEARSSRGMVLACQKRYEEALASFDTALAIRPGYAEALYNRGNVFRELERHDQALADYVQAVAIRPELAEAWNNRGVVLAALNRPDEALVSYAVALALAPDYAEALNNRGQALEALGRHDEALTCYAQVLALRPDFAEAHANEGLCRLLLGDYARGWEKFEWRLKNRSPDLPPRKFSQPRWSGAEDLRGKSILLYMEHGLGDAILCLRYVPLVVARGAAVTLEVAAPLAPLVEGFAGIDRVIVQGQPVPETDFQCSLFSLPLAFGTTLDSIPAAIPYLAAKEQAARAWRERLALKGEKLVGVCWRGNPAYPRDAERSCSFERLAPLWRVQGIRYVSLQKELTDDEGRRAGALPNFVHPGAGFSSTAEMVAALDLVVTVDTFWAHFAGAIGKPFWLLLPFHPYWVWLTGRADSPWYPTARLFRQTRIGDWDSVIERVREALLDLTRTQVADLSNRPEMQTFKTQSTRTLTLVQTLEEAFASSQQGKPAEAERFRKVRLRVNGEDFDALHLLGVLGVQQGRPDEAIELIIEALRRNPGSAEAHTLLSVCAWSQVKRVVETLRERVSQGKSGEISPLGLLPLPETNASEQHLCARQYAQEQYRGFLSRPPLCGTQLRVDRDRLRIGYLSADFHEHPVSYLLAEVIERHERRRFEVFGYSCGPDNDSPMRRRIKAAFDSFRENRPLSHEAAAQQILDDQIDILVDLTGYTINTRLQILALRPAPVQVSWLGYPGTLGHPRLADYLIGDPIVSPLEHAAHYSETLALMPNCFQPNDRQRAIGERPTRIAAGLPAVGFVYCCFNQSYKITPAMFDLWCRLLAEVPGSVLWLLGETGAVQRNLRREAQQRGMSPERLIFAPRVGYAEHLTRFQLADVFLDTLPFNAGATASDALWAGVPLVTCPGDTYVGRMAASLLGAAGMPELITATPEAYYRLALELAKQPGQLARLKARLAANRLNCPLFDSARFTHDLERLFHRMWADYRAGTKQPIVIGAEDQDKPDELMK